MKRILKALIIIIVFILITGCSNDIIKNEYKKDEEGFIDNIYIMLTDTKYENNTLECTFKIENKTGSTITMTPDNNFRLYDINMVQIPNIYQNNTNIIKNKDQIYYTLQYNIDKKNLYEILFYSNIVENNIKFTITNMDL